jgi:hypothetical protein
MPIKLFHKSKADHIVYRGTETFVCPHCHYKQTTEAIELRQYDPSQGSDNHLVDATVLQVVLLEGQPMQVEIVYSCQKCHLLIKFTRKIEGVPST